MRLFVLLGSSCTALCESQETLAFSPQFAAVGVLHQSRIFVLPGFSCPALCESQETLALRRQILKSEKFFSSCWGFSFRRCWCFHQQLFRLCRVFSPANVLRVNSRNVQISTSLFVARAVVLAAYCKF